MRDYILGEICQIRADAPIPERFVEIEAAGLIGLEPPEGGVLLRKIMYVGEAAEVVANALNWERSAEREACAQVSEHFTGNLWDADENALARRITDAIRARSSLSA
jgi:hypothetical protein